MVIMTKRKRIVEVHMWICWEEFTRVIPERSNNVIVITFGIAIAVSSIMAASGSS